MTALEIFLLIIGIVLIFGSFFLTDNKNNGETAQSVKEINVELTQAQKQKIELQVDNIIDTTLKTSVEKTEAEFDKISNSKMTELSDYSDNIINDINKNHNEVMFLYDMLGEKEKELKSMLTEIDGTKKRIAELKEQSYNEVSKKAEDTSQFFNTKIMELKTEMENVVNVIEQSATDATKAIEDAKNQSAVLLNERKSDEQLSATVKDADEEQLTVIAEQSDNEQTAKDSDKDNEKYISEDDSRTESSDLEAVSEGFVVENDTVTDNVATLDTLEASEDTLDNDRNKDDSDKAADNVDEISDSQNINNDKDSSAKDGTAKEYKKTKNQTSRSTSKNNGRNSQKNQRNRKNSKEHKSSRYSKYDGAINSEYVKKAENTTIEFDTGANNNKQILELHSQGKSNIEIAKELGLGMGEVKLVIDLFRGGKR